MKYRFKFGIAVLCAAFSFHAGYQPNLISAEELVVNTLEDDTSDNELYSLREAVNDANASAENCTIRFADGLAGVIELSNGEIVVAGQVQIVGPGTRRLSISGAGSSRIFRVTPQGQARIESVKLCNGLANENASVYQCSGGALLNEGQVFLNRVVICDNHAVGNIDVDIQVAISQLVAGTGVGGAIANFGELNVHGCSFWHNVVTGADNTVRPFDSFPLGPSFVGNSFGGAIASFNSAHVTHCLFVGNRSVAGNDCQGDFGGIALGPAILSGSDCVVSHSWFGANQAVAGSRNVSPFHNGHSLGGAICSGSLDSILDPSAPEPNLEIYLSSFSNNQSLGGNENVVFLPPEQIPPADGPNNAYGGAILAFNGSVNIRFCNFNRNAAVAGTGGTENNGSLGVGGAVFLFSFINDVRGNIEYSNFSNNRAVGGDDELGTGGDGLGGALCVGSLGAPFGTGASVDSSNCLFSKNVTVGGSGENGGAAIGGAFANVLGGTAALDSNDFVSNKAFGGQATLQGGDAFGGAIANVSAASLALTESKMIFNSAQGGSGNVSGQSFGGGAFNDANATIDSRTKRKTRFNRADFGRNLFGF